MNLQQTIDNIAMVAVLSDLRKKAKNDNCIIAPLLAKMIITKINPKDAERAYMPVSDEQGRFMYNLIIEDKAKNIIEFGTSFGISTLYLAEAARKTNGKVITTEIVAEKCHAALTNFQKAGLENYVELWQGDAVDTLKKIDFPVDFLLLDGWKDLYLPVFNILEHHFHSNTKIFVDNTNFSGVKHFLKQIKRSGKYIIKPIKVDKGNSVLIELSKW